MMCAAHAGQRGKSVLLIDHSEKIGRKILISGGGRCNFTNIHAGPENFHSANPHFAKSALSRYTPQDFIELVRKHRIAYHEKKLGQLFCDRSAEEIVDLLVKECNQAHAEFLMGCTISGVSKNEGVFKIHTSKGKFQTQSLVIASGGLSIPPIGATGFGYEIARQFGLKIEETSPALVGFDFNQKDMKEFKDMAGVSFDSSVTSGKKKNQHTFRENTLITHTGMSGPAILQASLYWNNNEAMSIDACPHTDIMSFFDYHRQQKSSKELKNLLPELLPKRLAEKLCELVLPSKPLNQYSDKQLADFAAAISSWQITPAKTFGYAKAEVTRGGVSTDELSSKDMMAKKVPGLFFIGEVVDVTGQLGGFNFQWAWASGYAAGTAV